MNKRIFLLLAITSMCAALTSCGNSGETTTPSKIWFAYSSENLISDFDYFDETNNNNEKYINRDNVLRFSCMKNENEGAQLMITASRYINSFDFELPDVTGPNGTINKDQFSVSAAHYLNIDYSNERNSLSGYYPDALIPLPNYKFRRMNFIDKGRSQALYINLKTEKNTPAGEYSGVGKLYLDRETIEIPFEVKVYDAVMPDEVHQNAAFGIWYDQIIKGEKDNTNAEMSEKYYDFVVSKRISPRELPPELTQGFDAFIDTYLERVVRNEKVASVRFPLDIYNFNQTNVTLFLQKLIDKNIELREAGETDIDLFKKGFFYIDDEPYQEQFALVREHDSIIFLVKKLLCNQLSSYPDLFESFTHIPNVVTREFVEEMVATNYQGGIQCWCPITSYFQKPEDRELYKQRQASTDRDYGENVWWYTCCDPVSPYPNFHLDANLMYTRALRYMQYAYDIEAQIFWCVNYYSKYSRGLTLERDIWNDAISWQLCAGDGQLMYPGYNFGINGPITTLRMENILASNEEYEYLWMIDQKIQEYNSLHGTEYVTNELLNKYYSRLFTNMIADTDTDNFEAVRIELLLLVETMYQNLDSGIASLLRK